MPEQTDFDSPWKDILDLYFKEFMQFFFPAAYEQVDWARGYDFLDKELQRITADAVVGRRTVDKLVRVYLVGGDELWVLIHIEVQSQRETDFAQRMFVYYFRIRDRFGARCASFAILADDDASWRPNEYRDELLGTQVSMRFSYAKLLDLEADEASLEKNQNLFSVVVLAHAKTRATRNHGQLRFRWKFALTRMLYERGYAREQIIALFRFIDWVMLLPDDLQAEYAQQVLEYEKENKMPYISPLEREAAQQGEHSGQVKTILRVLTHLFGPLDTVRAEQIRALPIPLLDSLSEAMLDFTAISELDRWLGENAVSSNYRPLG